MARKPYVEPVSYIPEEIRKKNKVGEFNEEGMKKAEEFFGKNKSNEKANQQIRDFVNGK